MRSRSDRKRRTSPRRRARRRGNRDPTGRKPLPGHLEAEEHELRPDACAGCGGTALDVADELVEEKLHVVKEHQRRRVVRRCTCRCRACGERTTLRSLPAPYERSKVTCEWLAWLVYQKFWLLTPLDRIRRDLAERGVPIAMSTLVTFIERAADLLSGIDGLHWKQLLASSWMATDGTGLKVIVPSLASAHNGYVELYRNDEDAVFQYEPDKSGAVIAAKLKPFRGTLTADAKHRFNDVFASGRVLEAGCNAHGRRKFRDAEATQPVLAPEGGAFLGAMYGEEEKAHKLGLVETRSDNIDSDIFAPSSTTSSAGFSAVTVMSSTSPSARSLRPLSKKRSASPTHDSFHYASRCRRSVATISSCFAPPTSRSTPPAAAAKALCSPLRRGGH